MSDNESLSFEHRYRSLGTSQMLGNKKRSTRDREKTRARILSCAIKEFAERGYDGARVDSIVARADVSKNLIYHYFHSKERLFIEVMESAYAEMRTQQNEVSLAGLGPIEGCLGPLKLSHICFASGRVFDGSEAVFGRGVFGDLAAG